MAENKKSFILYRDIITTVEQLTDEQAGKLFKHILRYVNDLQPTLEDVLMRVAFEPIRQQLKRDLEAYNRVVTRNKVNGSKGGRPNKPKKPNGLNKNPNKPKKADNDNDTDNDTDINKKNFYKKSLSATNVANVPPDEIVFYKIAIMFWQLFKENQESRNINTTVLDRATNTWVRDIRLMMTSDKRSKQELRAVYELLKRDTFWQERVMSTKKLRKNFDSLIMQANGKKGNRNHNAKGVSDEYIQGIADDLQS